MNLSIEVIVPTLNRPDSINNLLQSLLIQSLKPKKITIIDAGIQSIDYKSYTRQFEQLGTTLLYYTSKPGLTYQRNLGIVKSNCDLVLFSDDDVVLHEKYIETIVSVFENDREKKIGGATGRMTNFQDKTTPLSRKFRKLFFLGRVHNGAVLPSGFANGIDYTSQVKGKIGWLSGCNMVYRREIFEFRWFDENLQRYAYMEDLDFSYRVSKTHNLIYVPEAQYEHHQAPQERLKDSDRYLMLIRHHHYLYKKNLSKENKLPHAISLLGILLQSLLLQRSFRAFMGSVRGLFEVIFMHNYTLPNFLERLDHSKPSQTQIAEHEVRYRYAADFCTDKTVLDCAMGEGIGADILCTKAANVVGVDLDNDTIEAAKKNIKHNNISYVCASALELPFPNNTFDVITSIETLEHIPGKYHNAVIAEFKRVLKPDGQLILSMPNKTRTSADRIAPSNYFHLCELTFYELKNLFEHHFYKVSWVGLYNPIREGSIENIKSLILQQSATASRAKMPFRKKLMQLMPFGLKDCLSLLINRIHIYPSFEEYQLIEEEAPYANNLIFVGTKKF